MARIRRRMSTTSRNDDSDKVTWMMLCVTTSFVVLLFPMSIYSLAFGDYFSTTFIKLTTLNTLNCAANFYIYFISGSLFRTEVKKLCRGCVPGTLESNGSLGDKSESTEFGSATSVSANRLN